jgi:hypothetical protein
MSETQDYYSMLAGFRDLCKNAPDESPELDIDYRALDALEGTLHARVDEAVAQVTLRARSTSDNFSDMVRRLSIIIPNSNVRVASPHTADPKLSGTLNFIDGHRSLIDGYGQVMADLSRLIDAPDEILDSLQDENVLLRLADSLERALMELQRLLDSLYNAALISESSFWTFKSEAAALKYTAKTITVALSDIYAFYVLLQLVSSDISAHIQMGK